MYQTVYLSLTYLKFQETTINIMSTLFTKIVNGEIPAYKVAEDDNYLAFLDVNPNAKGHTLCIPKQEINKIFDMEEEHYLGLMKFSRQVAKALEKTVPCKRVGVAVIGLEVPHVHVHLIPLNEMDEMRFQNKVKLEKEEFEELAQAIAANL
jgi:histidine triad (HIT) family protein